MMINFELLSAAAVSSEFKARNVGTFLEAVAFIEKLPYKRNRDKTNLLSVFEDNCGTCSTKHALLKVLAEENKVPHVRLMMGLFRMNGSNTPAIKDTLARYRLEYIPEAHNYLKCNGQIIDATKPGFGDSGLQQELMQETEIAPYQITDFKVNYHKAFMADWLKQNHNIPYDLATLWNIKEQCIADLSN